MRKILSEDENILIEEYAQAPPSNFDQMPQAEQIMQACRPKIVSLIDTLLRPKEKFVKMSSLAFFHYPVWPKWQQSLFVYDPMGKDDSKSSLLELPDRF